MLFAILAFVVGVIVGAFSHKWLAAEAVKAGIDPVAIAAKANAAIESPLQKGAPPVSKV